MAMRIVVLASGRGSNFAAIARGVSTKQIPGTEIVGLISNRPEAPALAVAKEFNVPAYIVDSNTFMKNGRFQREDYEEVLAEKLEHFAPDYICLAGYMLLLGKKLVQRWPGKIINIHPSLLPSFPGLRAQRQALLHGVQWSGCTVHVVTEVMDSGPIIAQEAVRVMPDDNEETLSRRILEAEHRTYVEALKILEARWRS